MRIQLLIPRWHPTRLNEFVGRHWGVGHRRKAADAQTVGTFAKRAGLAPATLARTVDLTLHLGPRQRGGDRDAYWKSLLDALKQTRLLVDDSPKWCTPGTVDYVRATEFATTITLTDAAPEPLPPTPDELAVGHIQLARKLAREIAIQNGLEADDLFSAAQPMLTEASRRFKVEHASGAKFTTFVYTVIQRGLWKEARKLKKHAHDTPELDALPLTGSAAPATLQTVTDGEYEALNRRHLCRESFDGIGRDYGLDRQATSLWLKQIGERVGMQVKGQG